MKMENNYTKSINKHHLVRKILITKILRMNYSKLIVIRFMIFKNQIITKMIKI
jgi:hypothetical protein